jgi:hypothetical protein
MTKQWYNNKVEQKPSARYNPSVRNRISPTYRPWFGIVAILCLLLGIALVCVSVVLEKLDTDLEIEFYQLWVGIPVLVYGAFAVAAAIFPKKPLAVVFVILSFALAAIAIAGAFGAGFFYWKDGWRRTKLSFSLDRCAVQNNICKCSDIEDVLLPVQLDNCDDVENMIALILAEIVLSSCAFIVSIIGLFVSFMSICCGPWMYFEPYDPKYDPDIGNEIPSQPRAVEYEKQGSVNPAYGGQTQNVYYY